MSLTKVSYSMLNGGPYNVLDFGADPTGSTDNSLVFQAAIDAIVATGIPSVLKVPAGTYNFTGAFIINLGYVTLQCDRAVLDFSTFSIGAGYAIRLIGGNPISGNPYNQVDSVISGFKLKGPGTANGIGLYFDQDIVGSNLGPAHTKISDVNISGFNNGVTIGTHTYLITFDHISIFGCYRGIYGPVANDSGENIRVINSTIFACTIGITNENGAADYNFSGVSFDFQSNTSVEIILGQASFVGCHFETTTKHVETSANTFTTFTGCEFINTVAAYDKSISNNGYMSIYGGRISANDTATNIVYSSPGSRINIIGTHIQSASASPYTVTGSNYFVYLPNTGDVQTNASYNTTNNISAARYTAQNSATLTVLNTYVSLGVASSGGLFAFRDATSGGTALYMADTSAQTAVQNGITGFEMTYTGSQMSIRVTSGTVPRTILWNFLQTNAS
jgi:hypothetical protein